MDYDGAEAVGYDRQQSDGTPTLAQWARAQAVMAIYTAETPSGSMRGLMDRIHILAEMIITGGLPARVDDSDAV